MISGWISTKLEIRYRFQKETKQEARLIRNDSQLLIILSLCCKLFLTWVEWFSCSRISCKKIRESYFSMRQSRWWLIKVLFHFPLQNSILGFIFIKIQVYFLCYIFSISSLNLSAVSEAMTTLMEHALYQNPSQPSWLRTQVDIHFGKYSYFYKRNGLWNSRKIKSNGVKN